MAFAPRKKKSARLLSPRTLGVLGALTVGASLLTAPQALAADTPTNAELLKACNWASFCKFRPQSYWSYTGPAHQVGMVDLAGQLGLEVVCVAGEAVAHGEGGTELPNGAHGGEVGAFHAASSSHQTYLPR